MSIKIILLVIVWVLGVVPSHASSESVMVVTGIKGSVNSTISAQVLREAYKEIGFKLNYLPMPGERALSTSNSGEVDGELFRIRNVEKKYKNLIPVPTPINQLEAVVFSKNPGIKIKQWSDLSKFRIGIQVGIKFAERGTKGMNRMMVDTNQQLFKMLSANRVDVAVVALSNGLKTINLHNISDVHAILPPIKSFPLYHYLHKKNKEVIPQLDKVLKRMQSTGRTAQIRTEVLNKLQKGKP